MTERVCAAGLGREVFQENAGVQGLIRIMIAANAPDEFSALKKRQGLSFLDTARDFCLLVFL